MMCFEKGESPGKNDNDISRALPCQNCASTESLNPSMFSCLKNRSSVPIQKYDVITSISFSSKVFLTNNRSKS